MSYGDGEGGGTGGYCSFLHEFMCAGGETERGGLFPLLYELWREKEELIVLFSMSYWRMEKS